MDEQNYTPINGTSSSLDAPAKDPTSDASSTIFEAELRSFQQQATEGRTNGTEVGDRTEIKTIIETTDEDGNVKQEQVSLGNVTGVTGSRQSQAVAEAAVGKKSEVYDINPNNGVEVKPSDESNNTQYSLSASDFDLKNGATPFRSFAEYLGKRNGHLETISASSGSNSIEAKLNYRQALQSRANNNQGIGDFAKNIRDAKSAYYYAAINAGYGNYATESVLQSLADRGKALEENQATLFDVVKLAIGDTNNNATMSFLKNLIFGRDSSTVSAFAGTKLNEGEVTKESSKKLADGVGGTGILDKIFEKIYNAGETVAAGAAALKNVFSSGFEYLTSGKLTSIDAEKIITAASSVWQKVGTMFYRAIDDHIEMDNPVQAFKDSVMNLPPSPSVVIDPMHRLYSNHVVATTHVLNIIPGQLSWGGIAAREAGTSSYLLEKELNRFADGGTGVMTFDITSAVYKLLRASEDKDKRLGMFDPAPNQFQRVYNTLMAKVLGRLSPKTAVSMIIEDWNDGSILKQKGAANTDTKGALNLNGWGHFSIALGPNCTITETGSNSFTQDALSQSLEAIGTKLQETYRNMNSALGSAFANERKQTLKNIADRGRLGSFLLGEKVHMPRFWNTSDFNRSYTLSFRLESPYGDYESLVNYVYKPFITLLACSLPIQTSFYGASSPFCLRLDCPGMFTISEGFVSSIDFRRAPDVGTYNANGIATAIEVNMTIEDIDPWLSLPVGPMTFGTNINMQAWLDSLCGVSYQEIYTGGSLASRIEQTARFARMMPPSLKNSISNSFSEGVWKIFNLGNSR